MKQFIDIIPHNNLFKQDICLPHLKTKSLSMPTSKLVNYSHRYLDRNSMDLVHYETNNQINKNQKSIINLQQIQRKAKLDQTIKANIYERKKILSQYQTVDLWKQKHSLILHIQVKKTKNQKNHQKQPKNHITLENNINRFLREDENVFRLKKLAKINSHTKLHKSKQVTPFLPQEVLVQKINQTKTLKKDEKLETILRKQKNQDVQKKRRIYKMRLPVGISFGGKQKEGSKNDMVEEVNDKNNPSKWQTSIHLSDEQQF